MNINCLTEKVKESSKDSEKGPWPDRKKRWIQKTAQPRIIRTRGIDRGHTVRKTVIAFHCHVITNETSAIFHLFPRQENNWDWPTDISRQENQKEPVHRGGHGSTKREHRTPKSWTSKEVKTWQDWSKEKRIREYRAKRRAQKRKQLKLHGHPQLAETEKNIY